MNQGHGSKRPQREDAALAALLTEPTIADAAKKAGVGETTLLRWLADPEFRSRYRAAGRQGVEHAVSVLQQAASSAVKALLAVADDSAAPHAARVSAAKAILDQTFRGMETIDLADEISTLKRQMIEKVDNEPGGNAA